MKENSGIKCAETEKSGSYRESFKNKLTVDGEETEGRGIWVYENAVTADLWVKIGGNSSLHQNGGSDKGESGHYLLCAVFLT